MATTHRTTTSASSPAPTAGGRPRKRSGSAGGRGSGPPSAAVDEAANDSTDITLPLVGKVELPPVEHLLFYAVIAGLAAVELVEWPVALLIGAGKVLADNRSHKALQSVGEAMEDAG